MPLSRSRDYMSIGEVLDSLKEEFSDISISKIRFLEAEGLIDPERTGSGYRKFFDRDVQRLQYILQLQRDHFMPLKVIRKRLAEADAHGGVLRAVGVPSAPSGNGSAEPEAAQDLTGVLLSLQELCRAAGLTDDEFQGLVDFGVMVVKEEGSYDENDLVIAKAARKFFQFGVEPRHLRMYKQFADREADFFQRVVLPFARRKDAESQREAARSMHELMGLSRQMREGILKTALRETL
ncbi:MAG: MerR family transcriptional regulator [Actinobacteria bacterium]|nr:MerR family transcriptional regulator [Actinomycetota bacterium]